MVPPRWRHGRDHDHQRLGGSSTASLGAGERTPKALRRAIAEDAPQFLPDFDKHWQRAIADTYDLGPVPAFVARWWCEYAIARDPGLDARVRDLYRRAEDTADFSEAQARDRRRYRPAGGHERGAGVVHRSQGSAHSVLRQLKGWLVYTRHDHYAQPRHRTHTPSRPDRHHRHSRPRQLTTPSLTTHRPCVPDRRKSACSSRNSGKA
ncbi:DUF6247 family protein [Streptomyces sp. NPDC020766]|uniref:DUF6247 family protein n=1 Tax=Streptomyces sp. NPDC020766 TaxID=3155011 RepID=UPI0033D2427A